ncbi:MAG: LysM peptidoglycan-binding domain-containing protein [Spirochaetes bacterium]|nr:LysM peptidoglycan-binding domain-containing protein [Spirochaetota bacterium]
MLIFFFLFASLNLAAAQDIERPLRSINLNIPMPANGEASSNGYFPLLTPEALAEPLVQSYIARFSSRAGIASLKASLERGSLYIPFIRAEIEARGLPHELLYLPIVESNFVSTARSRVGATGLWQFMMNSIGGRGMVVNEFVDERMKFINSTPGALSKLQFNYDSLGSWPLALAAYNAGLGRVGRTVAATGINDYWELSRRRELPQETVHFVPRLLAISYILSQPRRFGVDFWPQAEEWVVIPLERQVSISALAEEAGADLPLLRRMNAHLLLGVTPPVPGYRLIVPAADAQNIAAALANPENELMRFHRHVINYGDTLSAIGLHYGVPVRLIEEHNPGIRANFLRVGQAIIIPAFTDRPAFAQSRAVATGGQSFDGRHTVARGDTLWSLAIYHQVSPQALAEANNMTLNQILREGRVLNVPIIERGR